MSDMNNAAVEIVVRAAPWTAEGVQTVTCRVLADGEVLVMDPIAGHFTRCHRLSRDSQRRIARLAALSVQS